MKNYAVYEVEDFIQDDDFRDWVQGDCHRGSDHRGSDRRRNNRREAFWLSFPERYPDRKQAMRQAEQFIRAATVAPELISEVDIRKATAQFIESTSAYIPTRSEKTESTAPVYGASRFSYFVRWGMAASALLAVVLGVSWSVSTTNTGQLTTSLAEASVSPLVETSNKTRQPLRLVLSDNSEVLLGPQSQLRYPSHFAGSARKVYLKGEASFSVTHQNQPFMVFTGEMVTKVLGTRFVVRAFDGDKKMSVQVLSGKVSVYKPKSDHVPGSREVNGLILHANQAAIFEKSDGNLTKTLVAHPTPVAKNTKAESLVYDEVGLPVILRELETSYGIPIQFDEQRFAHCKITATFSDESFYEKLDVLCKAASASYEITDGQLVISRKGER